MVFWFSKNTQIPQNTTSITNRQELLTPKVQHYSSQYLKTIASYYFKENNNFNYLLSSQDTELGCKAPDVVLTPTSCFRVRSELEAHQKPPAHDTRTRVATGFSTIGKRTTTLTKT